MQHSFFCVTMIKPTSTQLLPRRLQLWEFQSSTQPSDTGATGASAANISSRIVQKNAMKKYNEQRYWELPSTGAVVSGNCCRALRASQKGHLAAADPAEARCARLAALAVAQAALSL